MFGEKMINDYNYQVYAYVGDCYYGLKIGQYIISNKVIKVNDIQRESIKYESATSQARLLDLLLIDFYNEEEKSFIKKAMNIKSKRHPKNTSLLEYKKATAFEALIGYYIQNDDYENANRIINRILEIEKC